MFFDDVLELVDDSGGEDGGHEVDDEPGAAAGDAVADVIVQCFVGAGTDEFLDIFCCFSLQDVDDVVVCDYTEEVMFFIDNR